MYYIKLNLWHNSAAPYGTAQYPERYNVHAIGSLQEVREIIARYADNLDSVKLDKSVSALAINTDDRFIFQVAGYSTRRGMYCDLVPATEEDRSRAAVAEFVALAMMGEDPAPMTAADAAYNLEQMRLDGVEIPDGLSAELFAQEWNRQTQKEA